MKSALASLAILAPATLFSQEFVAPQAPRRGIVKEVPTHPLSIDGMVRQIFEVDKPWQLVNPMAPEKFGTGEKNVSKDTGGGTPHEAKTLTVVGVEW
jgi:hypothetical protein